MCACDCTGVLCPVMGYDALGSCLCARRVAGSRPPRVSLGTASRISHADLDVASCGLASHVWRGVIWAGVWFVFRCGAMRFGALCGCMSARGSRAPAPGRWPGPLACTVCEYDVSCGSARPAPRAPSAAPWAMRLRGGGGDCDCSGAAGRGRRSAVKGER